MIMLSMRVSVMVTHLSRMIVMMMFMRVPMRHDGPFRPSDDVQDFSIYIPPSFLIHLYCMNDTK